ncbi:MAG: ABC transporter permease [Solirubrobacterales bacterium]
MRYRYLFEQMVRRELRQKYKGSALGVVWYLVNPLVLMGAYTLVFSVMLRFFGDIPDYPLFLLVGLVVWVFFSQALQAAAPCLVRQAALVRKVRFPREIVPGAVATVQLLTFLIMLVLLLPPALAIRGTAGSPLLVLPLLVVGLFALVLGLSLLVSVLHAYYRDVEPVLTAVLLPWFFVTPIFFRIDDLPGAESHPLVADLLRWANPVTPAIEATRDVIFLGRFPDAAHLLYVLGVGALALSAGLLAFRRLQRELAVVL